MSVHAQTTAYATPIIVTRDMKITDMLGLGQGEDGDASEEREKATDQLSAPAIEEATDLKLHAQRCGLRFYLMRAEIRYVRSDAKLIRSEIAGLRLLLVLLVMIILLGGTDGGAVARLFGMFFHVSG